jgi:putative flippase GtrA
VPRSSLLRFISFGVVGAVGFLVDSGALYAAIYLGAGKYAGRLISYLCAVTVTWALNKRFTFADQAHGPLLRQWARFAASQLSGGAVNLLVYSALVHSNEFCAQHPVVAVGAGSIAGLVVNFIAAQRFVYNAARPDPLVPRE